MAPLIAYFVGASGIGKTAILSTLTQSKSIDTGPTVAVEMRSWSFKVDGRIKHFRLWDASGNNVFSHMLLQDVQRADIVVICFDTRRIENLVTLKHWMTITEQAAKKTSVIFYGIIHDGEEREIMPADIYTIADHAQKRRNLKDVIVAEGRITDRQPIYNAIFLASRHI